MGLARPLPVAGDYAARLQRCNEGQRVGVDGALLHSPLSSASVFLKLLNWWHCLQIPQDKKKKVCENAGIWPSFSINRLVCATLYFCFLPLTAVCVFGGHFSEMTAGLWGVRQSSYSLLPSLFLYFWVTETKFFLFFLLSRSFIFCMSTHLFNLILTVKLILKPCTFVCTKTIIKKGFVFYCDPVTYL